MKKRKAGRPKGSKNKTKVTSNFMDGADLKRLVTHYATVFVCSFHIDGAEKLAEKILERIRAKKER